MKLLNKTIQEEYSYDDYVEFEKHKKHMKQQGYQPSKSTEDGYSNENMDSYYGKYTKKL